MNGNCNSCDIEKQCGYQYKPTDCCNYRKFKAIPPALQNQPAEAIREHGTVFFKDNNQYRSQLRFPIADGAYKLVKIENPDITHPLFAPRGQSFAEVYPPADGANCKCEHWQACNVCHPTYKVTNEKNQ